MSPSNGASPEPSASPSLPPPPRRARRILATLAALALVAAVGWGLLERFGPGLSGLRSDRCVDLRYEDVRSQSARSGASGLVLEKGVRYRFQGTMDSGYLGDWVEAYGERFYLKAHDGLPDLADGDEVEVEAEYERDVHSLSFDMGEPAERLGGLFAQAQVRVVKAAPNAQRLQQVTAVAFAPDGASIAIAGPRGRIRVRQIGSGAETAAVHVSGTGPIDQVGFSPDGRMLAAIRSERVVLVDLAGGAVRFEAPGTAAVFAGGGRSLVVADAEGNVAVWDWAGRQKERAWVAHPVRTRALAVSPDGTRVATGGVDEERTVMLSEAWGTVPVQEPVGNQSIRVWDVGTGALRTRLVGDRYEVAELTFLDARRMVSMSRSLTVWDLETGVALFQRTGDAISPVGDLVANSLSQQSAPEVHILDAGGILLRVLPARLQRPVFSPDGRLLTGCGWWGAELEVWDVLAERRATTVGAPMPPRVLPSAPAMARLRAAVHDHSPHRRERDNALTTLGALGADAREAVPDLMQELRQVLDPQVLAALGRIGPAAAEAVPILRELLSGSRGKPRVALAAALGRIDPGLVNEVVIPALRDGRTSSTADERAVAAAALKDLGVPPEVDGGFLIDLEDSRGLEQIVGALSGKLRLEPVQKRIEALRDPEPEVRFAALQFFDDPGSAPLGPVVAEAMIRLLADPDALLRASAARILGARPPEARLAAAVFAGLLADRWPQVRLAAASALARMGDGARPAAAALTRGLRDPEPEVADLCAKALEAIRGE